MNTVKYFFLLVLVVCLNSCLTDLRTQYFKEKTYNQNEAETIGKKMLAEMGEQSGLRFWEYINAYEVQFSDEFFGTIGKMSKPYKDEKVNLQLNYNTDWTDGILRFKDGKMEGDEWQYKNEKASWIKNGSEVNKGDKKIKFWLPTYQYFIEFPFKIQEATAVKYAGKKEHNGIQYDLVLASWNTIEPQKKLDQYLLWINPETRRVDILEYTIRDMYPFIKGAAFLSDYFEKDGIWFPGSMKVKTDVDAKKWMHEMKIEDVKFTDRVSLNLLDHLDIDVKQIIITQYFDMTDESLSKRQKVAEERAINKLLAHLKDIPSEGNIALRLAKNTPRYTLLLRGINKKYLLEIHGDKIKLPIGDNGYYSKDVEKEEKAFINAISEQLN